MALLQFQRFGREKRLGVKAGAKLLAKVCKQGRIAINQARLQQRGLYGHILPGLGHAFADGAHAGANLQPRIPARANKTLQRFPDVCMCFGGLTGQQQQDIHI